ncbi:uncharacterized protein LOC126265416 [Aethina tumida]|uniref:uncharacterized protein LOC126265416 n=1 Tax=Aethina tumida TaxID=116153 RepID=UPI002148AE0E|nr:uncharacterized protein LOC126265416 [Aethina tumida]
MMYRDEYDEREEKEESRYNRNRNKNRSTGYKYWERKSPDYCSGPSSRRDDSESNDFNNHGQKQVHKYSDFKNPSGFSRIRYFEPSNRGKQTNESDRPYSYQNDKNPAESHKSKGNPTDVSVRQPQTVTKKPVPTNSNKLKWTPNSWAAGHCPVDPWNPVNETKQEPGAQGKKRKLEVMSTQTSSRVPFQTPSPVLQAFVQNPCLPFNLDAVSDVNNVKANHPPQFQKNKQLAREFPGKDGFLPKKNTQGPSNFNKVKAFQNKDILQAVLVDKNNPLKDLSVDIKNALLSIKAALKDSKLVRRHVFTKWNIIKGRLHITCNNRKTLNVLRSAVAKLPHLRFITSHEFDALTKEKPCEVDLLITKKENPFAPLSTETLNLLNEELEKSLDKALEDNASLKFNGIRVLNNMLLVTCANDASVSWIKDVMTKFDSTLMTIPHYQFSTLKHLQIVIQGPPEPWETVQKRLITQNPNLNVATWQMCNFTRNKSGSCTYNFLITHDDFKDIIKANRRAHYKFSSLHLAVSNNKDSFAKSIVEGESENSESCQLSSGIKEAASETESSLNDNIVTELRKISQLYKVEETTDASELNESSFDAHNTTEASNESPTNRHEIIKSTLTMTDECLDECLNECLDEFHPEELVENVETKNVAAAECSKDGAMETVNKQETSETEKQLSTNVTVEKETESIMDSPVKSDDLCADSHDNFLKESFTVIDECLDKHGS